MTTQRATAEGNAQHVDQDGVDGPVEEFDAVDAFMGLDKDAPKEPSEDEDEEADAQEDADEGDDQGEDNEGDDDKDVEDADEDATEEKAPETKAKRVAADDDEIVHSHDGKELRVSVKDVKRLVGQEAALTKASMQTSAYNKQLDGELKAQFDGYTALKERVNARWKKFENVDLALYAARLDDASYKVLKADVDEAKADVDFVHNELAKTGEKLRQREYEQLRQNSQNCLKTLKDNTEGNRYHIPEWNDGLYAQLMKFGVEEWGIPLEALQTETSPVAWKLLHNDMATRQATQKKEEVKKTSSEKLKKATPVVKTTPKIRVTKPGGAADNKRDSFEHATQRLARSGSRDDATKAFMALG